MSAHTPGPIEFEERTGGYVLRAPAVGPAQPEYGHYQTIGSATQRNPHPKHGGGVSMETANANARLWAAAPDLLSACEAALVVLTGGDEFISAADAVTVLEAAVAKAVGS